MDCGAELALDCTRGIEVDTIRMAIDAAVHGLGIVVGRRPLVDAELSDGSLVVFDHRAVRSEAGFRLVGLPEVMRRPGVAALRDWLPEEMAQIAAAVRPPTQPDFTEASRVSAGRAYGQHRARKICLGRLP